MTIPCLAVSGSRHAHSFDTLDLALRTFNLTPTSISTGDAIGADRLARIWAAASNVPFTKHTAHWSSLGKAAGPERNSRVLAPASALLALPCPHSKGTWNAIKQATKAGKPVFIFPIQCPNLTP